MASQAARDERVHFCLQHAPRPYPEDILRLLLERLVRGPEGVFDLRNGNARLVAGLVEKADNAADAADLTLLGTMGPDEALKPLLAEAVDAAYALGRTGARSVLHVALPSPLAGLTEVLTERPFGVSHRAYEMATPDNTTWPVELPTGMSWRAVEPDIIDATRAMIVEAFEGSRGTFISEPEDFRRHMLEVAEHIALLFEEQTLMGYVRVRMIEPDTGFIALIARAPAARGRGLGDVLLREGLRRLADMGAKTFELDVVADNGSALGLYERHGFRTYAEEITWERDLRA